MREGFGAERLIFVRPHGGRLQIGISALAILHQYVQNAPEKAEAGGILLGRRILETDDIIVDDVTIPMSGDRRDRFQFFRARQQHQEAINSAWRESNGTCNYLGEWHTHPELCPIPSLIDQLCWQRNLDINRFAEPIFFVIVGILEVRVWEGHHSHYLMPLRLQ